MSLLRSSSRVSVVVVVVADDSGVNESDDAGEEEGALLDWSLIRIDEKLREVDDAREGAEGHEKLGALGGPIPG
jgi:hypothetical protein